MAEKLQQVQQRRPEKKAEDYHTGCMGGILHFLDLQQRHGVRKALPYHKHRDGSSKSPKIKHNAPSTSEDKDNLNKDTNFLIKSIIHTTGRIAPTAVMRTLIGKKRTKGNHQKLKTSPFASQLLRTFSIHHLDSNDYVTPKESTSCNENIVTTLNSDETVSSYSCQDVPLLPKSSEEPRIGKQCEVYGTMSIKDEMDHDQINELGDHLIDKEAPLCKSLKEAKESLSKQESNNAQGSDREVVVYPSKECSDMMELFNANMELFLKIAQDPNFSAYYTQSREASSSAVDLAKSVSFPTNLELLTLNQNAKKDEVFCKQENSFQERYSPSTSENTDDDVKVMEAHRGFPAARSEATILDSSCAPSSIEMHNHKNTRKFSRGFKVLKQKIKDIVKENKKEHRRISMDGVLHKIPYGHKDFKNAKKEQGINDSYSSKNKSWKFGDAASRDKRVMKSSSINESLERYSLLLKSFTRQESQRSPQISKLIEEHNDLPSRKSAGTLQKTFSLPELQLYKLCNNLSSEVSKLPQSMMLQPSSSMASRVTVQWNYSSQLEPVVSLLSNEQRIDSNRDAEYSITNDGEITNKARECHQEEAKRRTVGAREETVLTNEQDVLAWDEQRLVSNNLIKNADGNVREIDGQEPVLISQQEQLKSCHEETISGLICNEQSMESYRQVEYPNEEDSTERVNRTREQSMSGNKQEQLQTCNRLNFSTKEESSYFSLHEDTSKVYIELSPNLENSLGLPDISPLEGSKQKPLQMHFEESGLRAVPQNHFNMDASLWTQNVEEDFDDMTTARKLEGLNSLRIQVDEKDEAEFEYVKDILFKSGFSGEDALGEWYSPDQPVDPFLFEEAEYSSHELEINENKDNRTLYQMLLFDLINEVLLEIYYTSFTYSPLLSHVDHIRPLPVGYHVLEEVWATISWYLSSQLQLDQTVESIVARDFMKSDGWMNLQHDIEFVGLELDELIMDDLIDEVVGGLSRFEFV